MRNPGVIDFLIRKLRGPTAAPAAEPSANQLTQEQLAKAQSAGIPYAPTSSPVNIPLSDTLRAQPNMAFPVKAPSMPNVASAGPPPPSPSAGGSPPSPPPVAEAAPPPSPSIYDELGPEGIEQILGMGSLGEQLQRAQALRDAPSPEGRYVSGGRMYVASSPIEHAVNAYGKYRGKKDVERVQGEQVAGRKRIVDLLRGP